MVCQIILKNFNPHSHEGSDQYRMESFILIKIFQSTLPRRERLVKTVDWSGIAKFQSTLPRRERLLSCHEVINCYTISIHTPTKGATIKSTNDPMFTKISIHTPTKGATANSIPLGVALSNFNPHSHEGSDSIMLSIGII